MKVVLFITALIASIQNCQCLYDVTKEIDLDQEGEALNLQPGLEVQPSYGVQPESELNYQPGLNVQPELNVQPGSEFNIQPELNVQPELGFQPGLGVQPGLGAQPELNVQPEPELNVQPQINDISKESSEESKENIKLASDESSSEESKESFKHSGYYLPVLPHHGASFVHHPMVPSMVHHQMVPSMVHHQMVPSIVHHQMVPSVVHQPVYSHPVYSHPVVPSMVHYPVYHALPIPMMQKYVHKKDSSEESSEEQKPDSPEVTTESPNDAGLSDYEKCLKNFEEYKSEFPEVFRFLGNPKHGCSPKTTTKAPETPVVTEDAVVTVTEPSTTTTVPVSIIYQEESSSPDPQPFITIPKPSLKEQQIGDDGLNKNDPRHLDFIHVDFNDEEEDTPENVDHGLIKNFFNNLFQGKQNIDHLVHDEDKKTFKPIQDKVKDDEEEVDFSEVNPVNSRRALI